MQKYCLEVKPARNKKLTNFLLSARRDFKAFFNIKIQPPLVFFVRSRRDIDKLWGRKTENWMSAWVWNNDVFILHPKVYTKESIHKDIAHFWEALEHEYCHLYFRALTGTCLPRWLNEGLACYLAHQTKKPPTKEEALSVFEYYDKSDRKIYAVGYFWVKFLIEKFGKAKLLKLIKTIHPKMTKWRFAASFHQIYKFRFNKKDFSRIS